MAVSIKDILTPQTVDKPFAGKYQIGKGCFLHLNVRLLPSSPAIHLHNLTDGCPETSSSLATDTPASASVELMV